MKLIKKRDLTGQEAKHALSGVLGSAIDRRTFLSRTGLALGGGAVAGALPTSMIGRAEAKAAAATGEISTKRSVCTHCSVGCGVIAEVQNGVWTGQEPAFDHPFNRGAHCAKGAAVREHGHGERRLKYPTKLVDGKWTKVSWEQAISEIGDQMLAIRENSGPDSVYWLGSAKHNNEQAYLFRKFAALWGTNNVDHQARIADRVLKHLDQDRAVGRDRPGVVELAGQIVQGVPGRPVVEDVLAAQPVQEGQHGGVLALLAQLGIVLHAQLAPHLLQALGHRAPVGAHPPAQLVGPPGIVAAPKWHTWSSPWRFGHYDLIVGEVDHEFRQR